MNEIGFQLIQVNTEQFAIIEDSYDDANQDFELEVNLKFGINTENAVISSIVDIQFKQNENTFLKIEASCEFLIEEEKFAHFCNEQNIVVPKDFLLHLVTITVGTTRGILHAKTAETRFNEFVLPTFNITDMLTEDGVFDKQ